MESDSSAAVTREAYRRKRRDSLDHLVDLDLHNPGIIEHLVITEQRRQRRCANAHKTLGKIGLAILAGVAPAVFAAFAGLLDRVSDFFVALFHGSPK